MDIENVLDFYLGKKIKRINSNRNLSSRLHAFKTMTIYRHIINYLQINIVLLSPVLKLKCKDICKLILG
jgi:hypothetical protein